MSDPEFLTTKIKNVKFGKRVKIIKPCNLYDCILCDEVFVGPFVEIQAGVSIGNRTRVQSHSFVCEGVTIGEDCFVGHGVMFINDKFINNGPAKGDKNLWSTTLIGDKVSIGSNATLLPVNICNDVVIGAGSVVTRDISEPGIYLGNPAKKLQDD